MRQLVPVGSLDVLREGWRRTTAVHTSRYITRGERATTYIIRLEEGTNLDRRNQRRSIRRKIRDNLLTNEELMTTIGSIWLSVEGEKAASGRLPKEERHI